MDRAVFEVRRVDAAGRLGQLELPRSGLTVETPVLLPVVNPHVQAIDPARLASEFGAEMLITNAYVLYNSADLRSEVLNRGIHDVLDFPGGVMTDSGSFQLAEYGTIDVDSEQILSFQDAIGSDVGTPVDIPTPPDASRERVRADLAETEAVIDAALHYDAGAMLLTAPIQGGRFLDLREQAAKSAYESGLDVFPIGAVVPLLREYQYADIVEIIGAAKRGLGEDAPVHLFGAGHPMMFALGVALGCDIFDSAAYALYARDGRYLTVSGTIGLDDLIDFPCHCPVCTANTPAELRADSGATRERLLSEHNLYVTFGEIRRVKEAIRHGELLELVEERARSHPQMLAGYRAALELPDLLERGEPATGARPVFYLSSESADRPEITRHHTRLNRLPAPANLVLVDPAIDENLPVGDPWTDEPIERLGAAVDEETPRWYAIPPFGPVPPAFLETYPFTAELPARRDHAALVRAAKGVATLAIESESDITLVHADWPEHALDHLPDGVSTVAAGREDSSGSEPDSAA